MSADVTIPICFQCKHYRPPSYSNNPPQRPYCAAFPNGIPIDIFRSTFDHREPHPDDNGIQFEPSNPNQPLSDDFLEEARKRRKEGSMLPPLIEDGDNKTILGKLLDAREYMVDSSSYPYDTYYTNFSPDLIAKLIDQVVQQIEAESPQYDPEEINFDNLNEDTPQPDSPSPKIDWAYVHQVLYLMYLCNTDTSLAICNCCVHFDTDSLAQKGIPTARCSAFIGDIPDEILRGSYDHRYPHPDDSGIQFKMVEDATDLGPLFNHVRYPMRQATEWIDAMFRIMDSLRRIGYVLPPDEGNPK